MEGYQRNKNYLAALLTSIDIKIIFLQEIWLEYHELQLIQSDFHDYKFIISTPDMFTPNEDKLARMGKT